MLVPEIALAPQTVGRFRARFGDSVAILHSGLTDAERRDERERIASGEARVVVGARSAIFAPMHGVGLICVDEEHDPSYKQESDPRYDARTVAAKRAALEGAVALYGSATPRPESWAAARAARARASGSAPSCRRCGSSTCAARPATRSRRRCSPSSARIAESGGKAILLLNRRGIAPALHCRACGTTFRCPDCDVALVLHRDERAALPPLRPRRARAGGRARSAARPRSRGSAPARSGSSASSPRKVPELELIRLDADTAANPEELAAALRRFRETDRAVLLGTQMVAKGHHFAGVELAAVVDADTGLGLPDFRAEERTFQLVTQLAGRSGRDAPGRVLVQTFQPDARPLALAANHDVPRFLADELARRRELGYPPFRHLVRVVATGPSKRGRARAAAGAARRPRRTGRAARPGAAAPAARASTAPSSSRRRTSRAASPRAPRSSSPPPRRRCAGPA